MVSRPVGSRCQSHPERSIIPAGMCLFQKDIGCPTTTWSTPSSWACAAMARPNGPAPMTRKAVSTMGPYRSRDIQVELAKTRVFALGVATEHPLPPPQRAAHQVALQDVFTMIGFPCPRGPHTIRGVVGVIASHCT